MPNYSNWTSLNSPLALLFLKLLFIHKLELAFSPPCKGKICVAQGIVSGVTNRNAALGKGCRRKTVRVKMLFRTMSLSRTELQYVISWKHEVLCFVRNKIFFLMNVIVRTIFEPALQPRATLLRRLPWAIIFRPFRTKN